MAHIYAVSIETVKGWAKQGMPGRPGSYDAHEISRWLRSTGPWRQHAKAAEEDELLLGTSAGSDSPGLERFRIAKANLAELELQERKRQLVSVDRVRSILTRWSGPLRRLGESLSKRFGTEASLAFNEALEECESVIDSELGQS